MRVLCEVCGLNQVYVRIKNTEQRALAVRWLREDFTPSCRSSCRLLGATRGERGPALCCLCFRDGETKAERCRRPPIRSRIPHPEKFQPATSVRGPGVSAVFHPLALSTILFQITSVPSTAIPSEHFRYTSQEEISFCLSFCRN